MTKPIIKSNTGSVGPLAVSTSTDLNRDLPITSVTIETKDLKDVDALLNFTCQINLPEGANVNLIFIIKKYVDKGCEQVIGSSYVYTAVAANTQAESFSFQFVDKDINPGKYTYSIHLASNSVCNCNGGTTVTNAVLNVLAIGEGKDDGKGNGGKGGNGNSGNNGNGGNSGNSADANSNANDTNSESAENTANSVDAAETNAEAKSDRKESKDKKEKEHKDDKDSKDKNEKDKDKKEKDSKKKDCKEKKNKDK